MNKIGIAIITCDRPEFFKKAIESVPVTDEIIVVNDGGGLSKDCIPEKVTHVIQNSRNMGVAASKNRALRELIARECDHLFLMEDDIVINNPDIYKKYIKAAEKSGIWHLNYALHGNYNRDQAGEPNVKNTIDYGDGVEVAFYQNILGAFSYYFRNVIKAVGYMDERYQNAFEHVDHTYRIIKKGLHPPFWNFADVAESWKDIQDQTENYEGSKIRNEKDWQRKFQEAMAWFKHKHGFLPTQMPQAPDEEVLKILNEIQTKYARDLGI